MCHAVVEPSRWTLIYEQKKRDFEAAEQARAQREADKTAACDAAVARVRRSLLHINFLMEEALQERRRRNDEAQRKYKVAVREYDALGRFARLLATRPQAPPPSSTDEKQRRVLIHLTNQSVPSNGRWTTHPVLSFRKASLDDSIQFTKSCHFSTSFEYLAVLRYVREQEEWNGLASTIDTAIVRFQGWLDQDWRFPTVANKNPEPTVDYSASFERFRQGAMNGVATSQHELGRMYANGHGVPVNYSEALKWYRLAADQGYAPSQRNIGYMYAWGQAVPKNFSEALVWYRKAADSGDAVAMGRVGRMYAYGEGVAQNLTEAQNWYRKAAYHGDAVAMRRLGTYYFDGEGVEKNDTEALDWYRKAAAAGDDWAHRMVGRMYHLGQGVERDTQAALKWYRKAAEIGDADTRFDAEFFIDLIEGKITD